MASISANGAKGHHKFTLTVTETGTSTENNTSTVKYTFQLSPVQTSWAWEQWGSSISYTININGTKYTGTIPNYDGYSTVTLKSGTQTVTHSSDGSKSISYSFSVTDGAGQYYTPGNASASDTLTLTTIPRATTPTLSATSITVNGSNSVNITVKPASSSFKHKIRYAFGSLTGQSKGVSIGTDFSTSGDVTVKFTPPVDVLRQIPSKNSDTCTISCYTYTSSGTHIGTKSVTLTFNVPSYTPTIAANLTGNKLLSGEYVQGKSTATFDIVATTSYGATIKSYSSVVDGKTYTTQKFTTSALTKGDKTIKVTVTDTRGKTNTYTSAVFATVREYATPKITDFTLVRQSDGTTVIATVKGTVSSVNSKNAKNVTVTLNGVTKTITSSSYTIDGTATFTGVSTDNTYTGAAKITDSYTYDDRELVLPTVAVTMDFHSSGKGVAFGKVAELENTLDLAWDIKVNDKKVTLTRSKTDVEAMYYAERSDTDRRVGFGVGGGGVNRGLYDYYTDKWIVYTNDNAVFVGGVEFSDTGWKTPTLASGLSHYDDARKVQYRRVGKQVYIQGAMKPTETLGKDAITTAFTLPAGYRPSSIQYYVCQGSSRNVWCCAVNPDGIVNISRYGTTAYIDVPSGAWLPICVSFLVD